VRPPDGAAGTLELAGKVALVGVLAAAPWLLGAYGLALAAEVLVFALFAMSLDVVLGYGGLVSLGHAAFFGLGGYGFALLATAAHWPVLAAAAGAVALAGAGGALLGAIALRGRGVGFIMLTFALAQLLHTVVFRADWAGGSNGLVGLPRPAFAQGETAYYFAVLAVVVVSAWLLARVVDAPFGRTLVGIRENPSRMRAMGYAVDARRLAALVVAAFAAGAAGVLYGAFTGYVGPDVLDWRASGEVLIMAVLGGVGTLRGPALGAAAFILLREVVSSYTEHWMLVLGLAFVAVVLVSPDGLLGVWRRVARRLSPGRAA
jgi:branched-chain amino acid transport system permease protein